MKAQCACDAAIASIGLWSYHRAKLEHPRPPVATPDRSAIFHHRLLHPKMSPHARAASTHEEPMAAAPQDTYPKIGHLKDVPAFRAHAASLGLDLPLDDTILSAAQNSPLGKPLPIDNFTIGNRWCIHPMEGWDANPDGTPSEHTL